MASALWLPTELDSFGHGALAAVAGTLPNQVPFKFGLNSCRVTFEDGYMMITSRNALIAC